MKTKLFALLATALLLASCANKPVRTVEDFNFDWKFVKGDQQGAEQVSYDDSAWRSLRLPHDWSTEAGYQKENTAASTGFVEGGIAWYRKSFNVPSSDKGKVIWVEFDGVYCNSEVYINGHKLGYRPNGFSSFSYELSDDLNYGGNNIIAVKVDHRAYADMRWYTGSGIYRNVRLVKTSQVHIPQWGVRITTPEVSTKTAKVHVSTEIKGAANAEIKITIFDAANNRIASSTGSKSQTIELTNPQLWDLNSPYLYTAQISVLYKGTLVDQVEQRFGIRTFKFDAHKGFSLNGKNYEIKGVNMHDDLGAVGSTDSKALWAYRLKKLKSIGVNAIRMAHDPHSPQLMDLCDEMGILVMNECFDEWQHPKGKNIVYIGDDAATKEQSRGYSDVFMHWAERDLKDLIHRDFNHPSVVLWSIGNEIEWTYPAYSQTFSEVEGKTTQYEDVPNFDTAYIRPIFDRITGGVDSLSIIAHQLNKWVKEEDTTRPTICASVRPTIAFTSGYADAVDIIGFNYRTVNYDRAHQTFPDKAILGSENWGAYGEWKGASERAFIPGIFVWTGFAYRGEAGPWPRKGLNISLFDFAGFKNPRGHFFECLWKDDPKVYMVTTPASTSEFSYTAADGWQFKMQMTPKPVWGKLRLWEWYKVNEHWNYNRGEDIVVQTYTNCEEAELFLNGKSLGKQALADYAEEDNIIKWLVPYQKGELKVIGYNDGKAVEEYSLTTVGALARIELQADKNSLKADRYDMANITVKLYDAKGNQINNLDTELNFEVKGAASLIAVDNGWEMNVDSHLGTTVKTHNGKALAIVQAGNKKGQVSITASIGDVVSDVLVLTVGNQQ